MTDADATRLRWITVLRWIALTLALLGVVWDGINIWWYIFPGPSGEWARLALPIAAIGGIPAGAFAFIFYAIARRPPTRLRLPIIIAATLSITLPILLALFARWH